MYFKFSYILPGGAHTMQFSPWRAASTNSCWYTRSLNSVSTELEDSSVSALEIGKVAGADKHTVTMCYHSIPVWIRFIWDSQALNTLDIIFHTTWLESWGNKKKHYHKNTTLSSFYVTCFLCIDNTISKHNKLSSSQPMSLYYQFGQISKWDFCI